MSESPAPTPAASAQVPAHLLYTRAHEWVARDGSSVRVGITAFAQDALGDIVFVTLPQVGTEVVAGAACAEVESTKSVSDVYAPASGTVEATNDALDATPELLNRDPYGEGWLFTIALADPEADLTAAKLLDHSAYVSLISGS